MKDWMHASKEEIENMTYQDMLEILEDHVGTFKRNPNDGFVTMRPHWMKTLETCIDLLKEKLSRSTEMRDATEQERKSIDDYVKSISRPTGFNAFDDEPCENELDFVQSHERIPVTLDLNKPCEDCVSRDAVHDMLENLPVTVEDKWFNWLQKACLRLADLPPVTPKQKTGKWIDDCPMMTDEGLVRVIRCSCCNEQRKDYYGVSKDYCPKCGAKMEGENE